MTGKRIVALVVALAALLFFSLPALADDQLFRLERVKLAAEVVEREPVGVADTFSADQERVYAFIEAREVQADTTVNFIWYRNEQEVATVPLPLRKSPRWRTFSSVTIQDRSGDWRVELHDEQGRVLWAADFRVE
ncbi:DUF2914 domain-containing protein [Desulfurivibrio alkaliphilus]|uniref:DUF2914 domain-containing protein n=1 Tax=Desulfurivibrio alkaliphilus (strain DSM 19089 / UNIQEM U267 / AHT2) TaxID=589865 RepID=D6Z1T4_DESAT|nr:DUF2914 domain-containing protein [Desulfurivibrio alkaliphilus]ADH85509.1 conserved hypothetical protein [Desulfurivibrio alkaliphilus AHT 2]